jgi:hypothetical protein
MTEWLSREEVDFYLDDREAKGVNVVQLCVLWGKRHEQPVRFYANAPNSYGHRALLTTNGVPDPVKPTVMAEPHYEGYTRDKLAEAIHMRRQAVE